MTHDLTDPLTGTLSGLKLGLPITALNRLRRRKEQQMTDARETILTRLADVEKARGTVGAICVGDAHDLLADCAAEIRQRDATIAELRGRVAALEAMTPGGVR